MMAPDDDLDLLAAEYALGVLDLAERRKTEARRRNEPALDAAITRWEAPPRAARRGVAAGRAA